MAYKAPVRDLTFILNEVLEIDRYSNQPGFADISSDVVAQVLEEGGKFAEEVIAPINWTGDKEGCTVVDGVVTTPKGWKEAYHQMVEAGWTSLAAGQEYGGQGLPAVVSMSVGQFTAAASAAFSMYPGLTGGAYAGIEASASQEIKDKYLPKMASGEWTGTMNLTEPQCGTDLGMVRTKAVPQADGSYKITGQKIWISAGEHDFADNIIHTVLARIEGAQPGIKGLSLFVVPKVLVNEDGSLGERNGVKCGGLEHKMGIHGNATCVMNYDDATGYLIGAENKGLSAMFVMMNEARLGVGLQGLSIGEIAYQNAANYARDRIQGRSLSGAKHPDKKADPIIVHPDIRRSLLTIRAYNEAGRAFLLWTALQSDIAHRSTDEAARQAADDLLGLVTPIVKGVLTDKGFDHAVAAQQVYGGHGYIEEWGMSQYVRDARITMIYEGANGIQALDLVGRKLGLNGGRAVMALFKEIGDFCEENRADENLVVYTKGLKKGLNDLQAATMWFMQNAMAKPDNAGAGSTDYMHLFGLVVLGYMHARMAKAAQASLASGSSDEEFLKAKLVTARFFMERLMPETALRKTRIEAGSDTMMELAAEAF